MTFDLAQMIADRQAGTPGEWTAHQGFPHIVCPVDHFTRPYGGSVDKNRDRDNYAHVIAMADLDRHGRGDNHANARRFARVPAMEAEILRLTARVERLTTGLEFYADESKYEKRRNPITYCTQEAAEIGPEGDCGDTARAALSTHTEEPKT